MADNTERTNAALSEMLDVLRQEMADRSVTGAEAAEAAHRLAQQLPPADMLIKEMEALRDRPKRRWWHLY